MNAVRAAQAQRTLELLLAYGADPRAPVPVGDHGALGLSASTALDSSALADSQQTLLEFAKSSAVKSVPLFPVAFALSVLTVLAPVCVCSSLSVQLVERAAAGNLPLRPGPLLCLPLCVVVSLCVMNSLSLCLVQANRRWCRALCWHSCPALLAAPLPPPRRLLVVERERQLLTQPPSAP